MNSIRIGTFETNSSSTHSIVIAMEKQFNDWVSGNCFYLRYRKYSKDMEKGFYTKEQVIDYYLKYEEDYTREKLENMDEDAFNELVRDEDFVTYENWEPELEHESETFVTPNGETICIECAHGYGG